MNLIVIYGAPAVGKLTVGKELIKKTGYKLLHLHLIADLASSLFEFGSPIYHEITQSVRLLMLETAARENLDGIVFTYGYGDPESSDPFIKELLALVEKYKITLHFIYLYCNEAELFNRVTSEGRKKWGKIHTQEVLHAALKEKAFMPISYVENILIDNTNLTPEQAALLILEKITQKH